jgi:hypothetical protein
MIPTQTIGASFGTYGASTVVGWGGKNVVGKCWWGYIYIYIFPYPFWLKHFRLKVFQKHHLGIARLESARMAMPFAPGLAGINHTSTVADKGDDDGGFWDALEETADNDGGARKHDYVGETTTFVSRATVAADGSLLLDIPPPRLQDLVAKLEQIALLSHASVVANAGKLRISGDHASRVKAERYACAVIDLHCDCGSSNDDDASIMSVSSDWFGNFRGKEFDLERDVDVLIAFGERVVRADTLTKYKANDVLEAQHAAASAWHMAVAIGTDGPGRVRLHWSSDGSEEVVPLMLTRPAPQVFIFGSNFARLRATVKILLKLEATTKGAIAFHLANGLAMTGLGLSSVVLPVQQSTMFKLQQQQGFMKNLVGATGCVAVDFFVQPKWCTRGEETPESACAILAGTREQRWQAGHILCSFSAGLERQKVSELPPQVIGECQVFSVPKGVLPIILGKGMTNLLSLMDKTETFVFMLREVQSETGPMCDLVIFGRPRARVRAQIKLMAILEKANRGSYQQEGASATTIDPSDGLAIDFIWLKGDFEDAKVEILAGASDCLVECVGELVFLAGTKKERLTAGEYVHWMTGHKVGSTQRVLDADSRQDMVKLMVPPEVVACSWLHVQMDRLAQETKTALFFDSWEGIDGKRRILVAGGSLMRRRGLVGEVLARAQSLVNEALVSGSKDSGGDKVDSSALERNVFFDSRLGKGLGKDFDKGGLKGEDKGKGKNDDKGKGKGDDKGKGKDDDKGKGKRGEEGDKGKGKDDKGKGKGKGKDDKGKGKADGKGKDGNRRNNGKGKREEKGTGKDDTKDQSQSSSRDDKDKEHDKTNVKDVDDSDGLLDIFEDVLGPAVKDSEAKKSAMEILPAAPAPAVPRTPAEAAPVTPAGPVRPIVPEKPVRRSEARSPPTSASMLVSAPKRAMAPPQFARVVEGASGRAPAPVPTIIESMPAKRPKLRGAPPPKAAMVKAADQQSSSGLPRKHCSGNLQVRARHSMGGK